MMKELKESQPLWKRLLALSAALILGGAALAFPSLGGGALYQSFSARRQNAVESIRELVGLSDPASVQVQIVARLRSRGSPGPAEIAVLFRGYSKASPGPRRFLMTGPFLRERPID